MDSACGIHKLLDIKISRCALNRLIGILETGCGHGIAVCCTSCYNGIHNVFYRRYLEFSIHIDIGNIYCKLTLYRIIGYAVFSRNGFFGQKITISSGSTIIFRRKVYIDVCVLCGCRHVLYSRSRNVCRTIANECKVKSFSR